MSNAKIGRNWADIDEDDDEEIGDVVGGKQGMILQTAPDKDGIKTIVEYTEKNGQTYKITKKMRVTVTHKRISQATQERKNMAKFGKAATNPPDAEARIISKMPDDQSIPLEYTKKPGMVNVVGKDDAEDKFYEEALTITENLFKEKKIWAAANKDRTDEKSTTAAAEENKDPTPAAAAAAGPAGGNQPGRYLPPSLRGADGKGGEKGGKGGGKGDAGQEASLRVTNLSEDVKEGDLQDLFGQCGRLQRVYLAKDMATFQSKGFAFITYYNREDAQRAIDKLNGHGYDNLILQVNWAKPRA
eukprot:TRINITY_DN12945_c0_g1_i1.p1 TRINITY_DN12945_c0_g1~~TRINITY_DN12945_c0_g1_i1.p1  ORF type:complete len:301 (+),score=114.31 TRINITY_DN12945_c0_g1_i1:86-988(+)